jgi:hypothetical protein
MVDLVLHNLMLVGFAVILLGLAMLSNTCFGLWYNVKSLRKKFDCKKLLQSLLKFLVFVVGLGSLSILVTLLPAYAQYSGVDLPQEAYEIINILLIVSIFITSIISYAKQAIDKLKKILGSDNNG